MNIAAHTGAIVLVGLGLCPCALPHPPPPQADHLQTLRRSTDREKLADAAVAVAASKEPKAVSELGALLGTPEFLGRLDDLANPQARTSYLRKVMLALEANPSPATERMGLTLAADPDFTNLPVRMNYLLPVLAAVRPMSKRTANLFRRTGDEGFYSINGPLLTGNGTPQALEAFEAMLTDRSVPVLSRVESAHRSIVPHRTEIAILKLVERLTRKGLDPPVEVAVIESIFDYKERQWFGVQRNPPTPREWTAATPEARRYLVDLGRRLLDRGDLPNSLKESIRAFVEKLRG